MKLYQKSLLTLTAAGTMVACQEVAAPERFPKQGVVTGIDSAQNVYYLDMDGDGLTDKSLYIFSGSPEGRCCARYVQVGDTLKYATTDTCAVNLSTYSRYGIKEWGKVRVDSVNNRSIADLEKIDQINQLRSATGQTKMR